MFKRMLDFLKKRFRPQLTPAKRLPAPSHMQVVAHEAGHALVASKAIQRVRVKAAAINFGPPVSGAVIYESCRESPFFAHEQIIISLGGIAGELIFCGKFNPINSEKDLKEARRHAEGLSQNPQPIASTFDVSRCFTSPIDNRTKAILNNCFMIARQRILDNEESFKALTRALSESGKLTGTEITRLLRK